MERWPLLEAWLGLQECLYAYWVTRIMNGHRDAHVLDGAQKRWALDGHPLSTDIPNYPPVDYLPQRDERDDSSRVFRDDVLEGLGRTGGCWWTPATAPSTRANG